MKVLALVVLLGLFCIVQAKGPAHSVPRPKPAKVLFEEFAAQHGKVYATEQERAARFEIFKTNIARIEAMNKRGTGALYGITRFSDLTPEEFKAQYLGYKPSNTARTGAKLHLKDLPELPTSFDWRDRGAVTPTKDQGQCGSCWAFSATEAIESQWFLAGHPLPVLSEQQIVDCDKGRGDQGCSGGDTPTAYEYVIAAGGLDSESSYPYTAEDDTCAFKASNVIAHISGWEYVTTTKNETEMMYGLVAKGPLSICVDASSWQFYTGGVITEFCGNSLDHCVMITGFKNEVGWDGFTYPVWSIRNSWGAGWGYGGYLYVERGSDLCGVADEVTLPKV